MVSSLLLCLHDNVQSVQPDPLQPPQLVFLMNTFKFHLRSPALHSPRPPHQPHRRYSSKTLSLSFPWKHARRRLKKKKTDLAKGKKTQSLSRVSFPISRLRVLMANTNEDQIGACGAAVVWNSYRRELAQRTGRLNDIVWYCERGGGGGDAAAAGRPCEVHGSVSVSSDALRGAGRHEESRSIAVQLPCACWMMQGCCRGSGLFIMQHHQAEGRFAAGEVSWARRLLFGPMKAPAACTPAVTPMRFCRGRAKAQNSWRDFPRARHFSSTPLIEVFIGPFLAAVADTDWLVVTARKAFSWGANGDCLIKLLIHVLFVALKSLVWVVAQHLYLYASSQLIISSSLGDSSLSVLAVSHHLMTLTTIHSGNLAASMKIHNHPGL